MKSIKNIYQLLVLVMVILTVFVFTSCKDDEPTSEIKLHSYGPSPALRGGQLKFIGTNLDKVSSISLPDNITVEEFVSKSANEIVIMVPEATVGGQVKLNTPDGEIVPKSNFEISEPIAINSFTQDAEPGEVITIEGTYLNLVTAINFAENKLVEADAFDSHSASKIEVAVPVGAQTGKFVLWAEQEDEEVLEIESASDLMVASPKVASFTPTTVKPGTVLTVKGSHLDLATRIVFTGGVTVASADFVSQTATEIQVNVPMNIEEGRITIQQASPVDVESAGFLLTTDPSITSINPNPAKNGQVITISGADLDLVTTVAFAGGVSSSPNADGWTASQFTVTVPDGAIVGPITLNTQSSESVESLNALELVRPSITTFSPAEVWTVNGPSITITGQNLDLVTEVTFPGAGGWVPETFTVEPSAASANSLTVEVPPGAVSGNITLSTANGTMIHSIPTLTIVPDVPEVTAIPASTSWGVKMVIQGNNLDMDMDIIFPGGIRATRFGAKTSNMLEVFVPADAEQGESVQLAFITTNNEVYWSPTFELSGVTPLTLAIFNEGFDNGYGDWSWGDIASRDNANTEEAYEGDISWKATWGTGQGSLSFGGGNAIDYTGYEVFAFAVYGGEGMGGTEIQVRMNDRQDAAGSPTVTVVEGVWTEFEIPIADFSAELGGTMTRVDLHIVSATGGVIYVDKVGFKE